MKKIVLLLCCIATLISNTALNAATDDPLPIPISIHEIGEEGTIIFRGPSQCPITCFLVGETIEVTFLNSLGTVTVEIENQTTGEYAQTLVNAMAGSTAFVIFGTAGHWTIMFTLPSGARYLGAFEIN